MTDYFREATRLARAQWPCVAVDLPVGSASYADAVCELDGSDLVVRWLTSGQEAHRYRAGTWVQARNIGAVETHFLAPRIYPRPASEVA